MKLTQAQLLEAAKAIGLQGVEVVENESDSDYDLNAVIAAVDDNRGKILRPKIEEEVSSELTRSIDGRRGGELRNYLIKETGIPRKDIEKIEKDHDAIKAAIAYKSSLIEGDTKEVKAKFDEIIAQHNTEKETLVKEWEDKVNAERNIRIRRDAVDYLQNSVFKDIPLSEDADRSVISQDYYNYLQGEFDARFDETGKKIDLYDKAKPSFPATIAGTSQPVNLIEHAKQYATVRGSVKKDMRDVNPAAAMQQAGAKPYQNAAIEKPLTGKGARAQRNAERDQYYKTNGLADVKP